MFDKMTQQAEPRQASRTNKNASSFNILSFDPSGSNPGDVERQLKREKQNAYRDQLDQMKGFQQGAPAASVRNPSRDKNQSWGGDSGHYQGNQYEQRDNRDRGDYQYQPQSQSQPGSYNDYKIDQHATDIQKNYNLGGGYTEQRGANRYVTELPGTNTFEQQDKHRAQLLDRIRQGYNNQNYSVYNAYQRAHEEREISRQDFERNVIDKAAREKMIKEQEAAMRDYDRKKRLQQEMSDANRRAIDARSSQKRREKEREDLVDQQRNQDAMEAHKRSEYLSREKMRRMQEETNYSLAKQLEGQAVQKQAHGKEISPSKYKVGWDALDNLAGSRVLDSQNLRNSSQVGNEDPYVQRQPQYEDPSYGMGNLSIGGQQQQRGYQEDPYARGYEQPSANRNQGYGQQPGYGQQQAYGQQAGSSVDQGKKGYDRFRHGTGFNIITNEYR